MNRLPTYADFLYGKHISACIFGQMTARTVCTLQRVATTCVSLHMLLRLLPHIQKINIESAFYILSILVLRHMHSHTTPYTIHTVHNDTMRLVEHFNQHRLHYFSCYLVSILCTVNDFRFLNSGVPNVRVQWARMPVNTPHHDLVTSTAFWLCSELKRA